MSMKRAIFINAAGQYASIILSLLTNAILARLIMPEEYGVMAIVTVFTAFFTMISDMGLSTAIIQDKSLSSEDVEGIYAFSVYVSFGVSLVFFFFSSLLALFYSDNSLISIGRWLCLSLLFGSLNMVPNGILKKDKRFTDIAIRDIAVYIITAVVTIVAAFQGAGVKALVIQSILLSFLRFGWSKVITKQHFHFIFKLESVKKISSYAGYQYAFSFLNYFARNLDNLLAGKYIGTAALAFYNKAYTLMLYPISGISGVISTALHPVLSDYQDDKEYIYHQYMKLLKCLAIISVFIEAFCVFSASDIIEIMYGKNWDGAIECFMILSISIVTQMITGTTGSIFQAIGETRLLFLAGSINISITVISTIMAIVIGNSIECLALFVSISYLTHFFISFFIMLRYGFKRSFLKFLIELKKEWITLGVLLLSGVLMPKIDYSCILNLIIKGAYFGIIYLICLLVTKDYQYFDLIRRKKHEKRD